MTFKYSYNTIVYTGEEYSVQSKRIAKYGYDAIELVGEPDWYNSKDYARIKDIRHKYADSNLVILKGLI